MSALRAMNPAKQEAEAAREAAFQDARTASDTTKKAAIKRWSLRKRGSLSNDYHDPLNPDMPSECQPGRAWRLFGIPGRLMRDPLEDPDYIRCLRRQEEKADRKAWAEWMLKMENLFADPKDLLVGVGGGRLSALEQEAALRQRKLKAAFRTADQQLFDAYSAAREAEAQFMQTAYEVARKSVYQEAEVAYKTAKQGVEAAYFDYTAEGQALRAASKAVDKVMCGNSL